MTDQNPIPTVAKSATTEAQYTGTHSSDCRCHLCVTPDKDQCSKVGIAMGLPWERPNDRCQRPVWKEGLCWFHHPDGKPKKSATTEPVKESLTTEPEIERLRLLLKGCCDLVPLDECLTYSNPAQYIGAYIQRLKLRAEKSELLNVEINSSLKWANGELTLAKEKLKQAERERDEAREESQKRKDLLSQMHNTADFLLKDRDALRAEIERLKRKQVPQTLKEIKPDESENARFREALSKVANRGIFIDETYQGVLGIVQSIAQAALAGKGESK